MDFIYSILSCVPSILFDIINAKVMIKAIIFDYGNVISEVINDPFLERLAQFSGKTRTELDELIHARSDLLRNYETGRISSDTFFEEAVQLGDLKISKEEFIKLFTGRFRPIRKTRELIRALKSGYNLGLLSNTNEWDFECEIKQCDVFSLFDTVTVSFKVNAMKPDKRIYLDALSKIKHEPQECVYIDDIEEYVDAACETGIKGIRYTSHEGVTESLRNLGVAWEG
jgi:putative hydrolase of the HAD superfamily